MWVTDDRLWVVELAGEHLPSGFLVFVVLAHNLQCPGLIPGSALTDHSGSAWGTI